MDENKKKLVEIKINKTIKALERNNMQGFYAKSKDELFEIIDLLIKDDRTITAGGSMTLTETGVIEHLHKNYEGRFFDRDILPPEERGRLMRSAFTMDAFFAGTNAITENGELYNVDGHGNRVSAMIFGPKQVILVAGYNKIVPDLESARKRAEKTAAPANAIRLKRNTPCAEKGECVHFCSDERICCSYVVLGHQSVHNRIKVILLSDEYGY